MNFLTDINKVISTLQHLRYECYDLGMAFHATGNETVSQKLFDISTEISKQTTALANIRCDKVAYDLIEAQNMNRSVLEATLYRPLDSSVKRVDLETEFDSKKLNV